MELGNNISNFRKEKHITQEALAEKLGVSRQAVAKWEANESLPDIIKVAELADFFEISVDHLLGREKTYLDKIIKHIDKAPQNSMERSDDDTKLMVNRYMQYMKSIGCSAKQTLDGLLAMVGENEDQVG